MSILSTIGAWLLSWSGPEGWRRRRERIAPHTKPQYDAYPDTPYEPVLWLTVSGRDAYGRIRSKRVDLAGYSLHHLSWRKGARRGDTTVAEWLAGQVLDSWVELAEVLRDMKAKHDAE